MSILSCEHVAMKFRTRGDENTFSALKDVSFRLEKGESAGIVGPSGSGKSTLAEILGGLEKPSSGEVFFRGRSLSSMKGDELKDFHRNVQYIFQDPKASMNPFFTIAKVLREPVRINFPSLSDEVINEMIESLLERLSLPSWILKRRPYELSGGQAQRIVIARALLLESEVIIADEPTSSLDISVQAQIINLMRHIRRDRGTSFIFISHDLDLVRYFSDRVYRMEDGVLREEDADD